MIDIEHVQRLPLASRLLPEPLTEAQVRRTVWPQMSSFRDRRNALWAARRPERWLTMLLSDDPIEGLVAVRFLIGIIREHERRHVLLARALGVPWREIARRRGLKHQGIHRRFASEAPGKGALST